MIIVIIIIIIIIIIITTTTTITIIASPVKQKLSVELMCSIKPDIIVTN
jgi:hypothetical protein